MSTAEALKKLTTREVRQVWLEHHGVVRATVTYNPAREELVIRPLRCSRRLTLEVFLFQTKPALLL